MIDVIIPAYNSEKYLPACLESLGLCDDSNAKVILIDDGSTDGTSAICDAFCAEHANACAIHCENAGAAAARNAGFAASGNQGQDGWVWFVDSDDVVAPGSLAVLERLAAETDADAIHFGCTMFDDGCAPIWGQHAIPQARLIGGADFLSGTYTFTYDHYLYLFLFRKSTLERLVDWRIGHGASDLCDWSFSLLEDVVFCEELMQGACRTICLIPDVLYGYRQTASSVSHSVNAGAADSALRALRYIDRFDVPDVDRKPKALMQIALLFNAYRAAGQGAEAAGLRKEIRREIEERVRRVGLSGLSGRLVARYVALESGLGDVLLKRREERP